MRQFQVLRTKVALAGIVLGLILALSIQSSYAVDCGSYTTSDECMNHSVDAFGNIQCMWASGSCGNAQ